VATAFLVPAAVLLGVPGLFIAAKGFSALRRRRVMVHGRMTEGPAAAVAAVALLAYGAVMIGVAGLLLWRAGR
jgi:hypothetical protein